MSFSIHGNTGSNMIWSLGQGKAELRKKGPIDSIAVDTLRLYNNRKGPSTSLNGRAKLPLFSNMDVSNMPKLSGFFGAIRALFDMLKKLLTGKGLGINEEIARDHVREFVVQHRASNALTLALMKPEDIRNELKKVATDALGNDYQEQDINDLVEVSYSEMKRPFEEAKYSRKDLENITSIEDLLCFMASRHCEDPLELSKTQRKNDFYLDITRILNLGKDDDAQQFQQFMRIIGMSRVPIDERIDFFNRLGLLNSVDVMNHLLQTDFDSFETESKALHSLETYGNKISFDWLKTRLETVIAYIARNFDPQNNSELFGQMQSNMQKMRDGLSGDSFVPSLIESMKSDIALRISNLENQVKETSDDKLKKKLSSEIPILRRRLEGLNSWNFDQVTQLCISFYQSASQNAELSLSTKERMRFHLFITLAKVPGLEIEPMEELRNVVRCFDQPNWLEGQRNRINFHLVRGQKLEDYLKQDLENLKNLQSDFQACPEYEKPRRKDQIISQKATILFKAYAHFLIHLEKTSDERLPNRVMNSLHNLTSEV